MHIPESARAAADHAEPEPVAAAFQEAGLEPRSPPPRVLGISLLALLVAGLASLVFPSSVREYAGLVWVLALVPVCLLAYYRGWAGAALATVGAMVVYIAIQVVVIRFMGREVDWRLFAVVTVLLIAVMFAVGGVIERVHRERREALRLAHVDPLTGLANRRLLRLEVDRALSLSDRRQSRAAMIYLDLGGFKRINDSLGHQAGDDVLVEVGRRLRASVRGCDTAARVGGDEFAVLLVDVRGVADAHSAARRVGDCFRPAFPVGDTEVHVTARLGAAVYPDHARDFDTLLSASDHAMYQLDVAEATEVALYGHAPVGDLGLQPVDEEEIRAALRARELRLARRPVYRVSDRTLAGAEASPRWWSDDGGAGDPASLDERGDSLVLRQLDLWALRRALEESAAAGAAVTRDVTPPWTASAVSTASIMDPELPRQVEALLRRLEADPGRLVLAVSERSVMRDPRTAIAALEALRSLGLKAAIVDFGSAGMSLSYLERFPADFLGIADQFMVRVGSDVHQERLLAGMIALGRSLGLTVMAGGVDRPEQLEWLSGTACDLARGAAFAA